MNEECLGCKWYNKPYWSIISPCTNCPKRFKNNTIKVTKYSINIDESDLYKQIEELQQRIELLNQCIKTDKDKIDYWVNNYEELQQRIGKAIEFTTLRFNEDNHLSAGSVARLLSILKGEEK